MAGAALMLLLCQVFPFAFYGELVRANVLSLDSSPDEPDVMEWRRYEFWLIAFPVLFWCATLFTTVIWGYVATWRYAEAGRRESWTAIVMFLVTLVAGVCGLASAFGELKYM